MAKTAPSALDSREAVEFVIWGHYKASTDPLITSAITDMDESHPLRSWLTFTAEIQEGHSEAVKRHVKPLLATIFLWESFEFLREFVDEAKSQEGEYEILKEALRTFRDANGNSVAHYAAFGPNPRTLSLAIEHGAPIAAPNHAGVRPLHLAACRPGPDGTLQYFLQQKGVDLSVLDNRKRSVLHFAAAFGCGDAVVDVLRCEQASKKPDVNGVASGGSTALHEAAKGTLRSLRDPVGMPSVQRLHAAAALLRWGARVNTEDEAHLAPLALAIRSRNDEVALLLLTAGASPQAGSVAPESPAMMAASRFSLQRGAAGLERAVNADNDAENQFDPPGNRRGCGLGVGALSLLFRAAANAWDPPVADGDGSADAEGEGVAGRCGLRASTARRVTPWVRAVLLALLKREVQAGRASTDDGSNSSSSSSSSTAAAAASTSSGGSEEETRKGGQAGTVTAVEFLLYTVARARLLRETLAFCDSKDGSRTIASLLLAARPEEAAALGLDASAASKGSGAAVTVSSASVAAFVSDVAARLAAVSDHMDAVASLAELDASGSGFQWVRGVCDAVRLADTYDASALHDFRTWDMEAAKSIASKAEDDSAALVQARRALGMATATELVSVLAAAATGGNEAMVEAFTPLVWDLRASGTPTAAADAKTTSSSSSSTAGAAVRAAAVEGEDARSAAALATSMGALLRPLSVLAEEAVTDERHGRTAAALRALEASFSANNTAFAAGSSRAAHRTRTAEDFGTPALERLAEQSRALRSAWRDREAKRVCQGVGGLRLCSPRTGCFDPTAGCAFQ